MCSSVKLTKHFKALNVQPVIDALSIAWGWVGAYWSKCNNGANTGSGQVIFRSLQCFLYGPMPCFLLLVAPCGACKQILQHQRRVGIGEDSLPLKWVPFWRTPGTGSLLWSVWVFRIRLLGEKNGFWGDIPFRWLLMYFPLGGTIIAFYWWNWRGRNLREWDRFRMYWRAKSSWQCS